MPPIQRTVEAYKLPDGTCPFKEWRRDIADMDTRRIIDRRIDRAAFGLMGDCKPVGEGVHELRIDYGPGYRVYFATVGNKVLLLLAGSDKSSQDESIKTARRYWKDFQKQ
jgi:putative addiction module killer protein